MFLLRRQHGQSLVEVIVAIGILAIGGSAVIIMILGSLRGSSVGGQYTEATNYARESWEALRSIGQNAYGNLVSGTYGISASGGEWALIPGSDVSDTYTRTIEIEDVDRNGGGDIVGSGGSNDIGTRRIITTISWPSEIGTRSVQLVDYFTNWNAFRWFEDLPADFSDGTFTNTTTATSGDGEVVLTSAGSSTDWGCYTRSGQFDAASTSDALDVAVVNTTAYIVRSSGSSTELQIVNVSTPGSPTLLGSLELGTTAQAIAVSGSYAYIGTISDTQELMIVNVSNPASPSLTGTFNAAGTENVNDVFVSGTRAYIVRDSSSSTEFQIINVSNPASPSFVGGYEHGTSLFSVVVRGTTAFAASASDSAELIAISIATEASPTLAGSINLTGTENALSLAVNDAGTLAWVGRASAASADLYAVNTASLSSMSVLASVEIGGNVNGLALSGTDLFAATNVTNNEIQSFKVNNPLVLTVRRTADLDGIGYAVASTGTTTVIATANDSAELTTITSASGFACLSQVGTYDAAQTITDIALNGSRLYIGGASSFFADEVEILDVTTPASITQLGSSNSGQTVQDIATNGNYAYIATSSNSAEIQILNATNPASPSLTSVNLSGSANGLSVFVSGSLLYFGRQNASSDEFSIFDISNPTSPSLLGSVGLNGNPNAIFVSGSYAYIASSDNTQEVQVIDISNPASPSLIGSYNAPGTADGTRAVVANGYLHFTQLSNGSGAEYSILDISNPASPSLVGSVEYGTNVNAVRTDGTYAFVVSDLNNSEFVQYNVTNPASPSVVATFGSSGLDANDVVFSGTTVFVSFDSSSNEIVAYQGYTPTYTDSFVDDTSGEFNLGTYSVTQFDTSWVELTAGGQSAGTGTFTSRVFDGGGSANDWLSLGWTTTAPSCKALPDNSTSETAYTSGNADMTGQSNLFHLDENAGATTFDGTSSANNDATCVGATCPTAGVSAVFNNGISCDGVDDMITTTSPLSSVLNGTASLSFWIKTTQVGNATMWLAPGVTGVESSGNGNDVFWGWITNTGRIGIQAGDVSGATSSSAINDGNWHHVVLTRNATTGAVAVYVDGSLSGSATSDPGVKTTAFSDICRIGDTDGSPVYFAGQLDEFAAWNRILSSTEITNLYRRGAMCVRFQVRSCDDAACSGESFVGPDGTASTFFSELNNASIGQPTFTLSSVADNRYFQYRATFTNTNPSLTPELRSVTIQYTEQAGGAFSTNGTYVSSVFDAGGTANWNTLDWTEDLASCPGSDIQVQIRTASSPAALTSALWQGPDGVDGDETDVYTDPDGVLIPTSHNGDRYIQYRVTLTGTGACTPEFEDLEITGTLY